MLLHCTDNSKKTCLSSDDGSFLLHYIFFVIVLLGLFVSSCGKKEKIELEWEEIEVNNSLPLNDVVFTDVNKGHVVGGNNWLKGCYLSTTDGGETWDTDSVANKRLFAIDFLPDGFGVALGIDGYHFRKETEAADWKFARLPYWDILRDVAYKSPTEGFAVGGAGYSKGVILKLTNNTATRRDSFDNELSTICYSDENTMHAMGYGIVLRSTDAGETWTRLPVYGDFYRSVCFPSESVGYAVGSSGTILKTTNTGADWKKIRDGSKVRVSDTPFRDLFFLDEERGYIVGENGTCWQTTDGGEEWQIVKNAPDVDFLGIDIIDGIAWLVTEEGRIFKFFVE
ncbi:MAG: hypothetical protein AB8F74_07350 [Saprospiraceae bacterium]